VRKTRAIPVLAATLLAGVLSSAGPAAQPARAAGECEPADVLNLRNWKLTLPIKKAKEILQPDLKSYESRWFTDEPDSPDEPPCTSVAFRTKVGGDTTSGSEYPRTELREMRKKGRKEAKWSSGDGRHEMSWRVAVDVAPVAKPQLVIGQVHDSDDDVVQVLYDGFNGGDINYRWRGETKGTLVEDYDLGDFVDLKIVVEDDKFELYANGQLKATETRETNGLYFKAGNYTQSNKSKNDDPDLVTQVRISDLTVRHD
jgi:poly(beta-D-mannuronate) lyase